MEVADEYILKFWALPESAQRDLLKLTKVIAESDYLRCVFETLAQDIKDLCERQKDNVHHEKGTYAQKNFCSYVRTPSLSITEFLMLAQNMADLCGVAGVLTETQQVILYVISKTKYAHLMLISKLSMKHHHPLSYSLNVLLERGLIREVSGDERKEYLRMLPLGVRRNTSVSVYNKIRVYALTERGRRLVELIPDDQIPEGVRERVRKWVSVAARSHKEVQRERKHLERWIEKAVRILQNCRDDEITNLATTWSKIIYEKTRTRVPPQELLARALGERGQAIARATEERFREFVEKGISVNKEALMLWGLEELANKVKDVQVEYPEEDVEEWDEAGEVVSWG